MTGFYDPSVRQVLEPYGLDEAELERGWGLLRRYAEARRADSPPVDQQSFQQLERWQNRWFVVCDAALSHAFPQVHAWLFNGTNRSSGSELLLHVATFIKRVRQLGKRNTRGLPANAALALQRLRKRGLVETVVAEGESALKLAQALPTGRVSLRCPEREAAAEDELWNWYLEWSGIARAVVKERRLLNHIGFGKVGRPKKGV